MEKSLDAKGRWRNRNVGFRVSEEEAKLLVERRQENLREQQRVEFGEGILPKSPARKISILCAKRI